jgi:SAM-dependent methyltransferase
MIDLLLGGTVRGKPIDRDGRMVLDFLRGLSNHLETLAKEGEGKEYRNVPYKYQLTIFDLTQREIKRMKSWKYHCLDIGCGNGSLVEYLRSEGLDCEGVDKTAPKRPHFINHHITGINGNGGIPRTDNTFDLVLAFQNSCLNYAFQSNSYFREDIEDLQQQRLSPEDKNLVAQELMDAQHIIYEGARVLRPGGRFMIYPNLPRLEEVMGPMLKIAGIEFHSESVSKKDALDYMAWEDRMDGVTDERYNVGEPMMQRTVITKTR